MKLKVMSLNVRQKHTISQNIRLNSIKIFIAPLTILGRGVVAAVNWAQAIAPAVGNLLAGIGCAGYWIVSRQKEYIHQFQRGLRNSSTSPKYSRGSQRSNS